MPFSNSNDGSGQINLDHAAALAAYSASSSNFTIAARPRAGSGMHAGGTDADVSVGTTFTTKAAAQAAVHAIVTALGYPWTAVGSVPDPVSNGQVIVAVNMANVVQMINNVGVGVAFGGIGTSGGYAPWADGPAAIAALQALAGLVAFP